jgi:hypothetical protein
LPLVLKQVDGLFVTIESCCSLDGAVHISELVLYEEVLQTDSKDLVEFNKHTGTEQRKLLGLVQQHFAQPIFISEQEARALYRLYKDPRVRLKNRDASLVVAACHLSVNGERVVVLSADPDFDVPVTWLMRQGTVVLEERVFNTASILSRKYLNFMRRLHDCCQVPSETYRALGDAYIDGQLVRLSNLKRKDTHRRIVGDLRQIQGVHTKALLFKCPLA